MALGCEILLLLLLLLVAILRNGAASLDRSSFPPGFIFGTASSAYQYEGGARDGGRGPSIWDDFTHKHPEKILDRSNGDVAVDSFHRYKEDIDIMKDIGLDAYRLSISWSRILPNGSLSGGINREGIMYYSNLINELISNGVQPFVTLFHFDTPQALEEKYGGFLSRYIVRDFKVYAEICFREFGNQVKNWITVNEPWGFCTRGYGEGMYPPGRCSPWEKEKCEAGDSGTEPYMACHHMLLAHAAAARVYKDKYQATQNGRIGITLISHWFVPLSDSKPDKDAANRALDFMLGWFMDPVTRGDYPLSMRTLVRKRLPKFTEQQSRMLNGSFDFIGINYYTTRYVSELTISKNVSTSYDTDMQAQVTEMRNGIQIGPKAASDWLYIYPQGIGELLLHVKTKYNNPIIYITENGVDECNNKSASLEEALKDDTRINFHSKHLLNVLRAIRKGADVRGYFAWSLLDNFEWTEGYTVRFGIIFVDFEDGLKRYPKSSAHWFSKFLKEKIHQSVNKYSIVM
ncbi:beta-glucosidase 12-like isoform X2 [Elaeis guineensis]|uniref:Beta-glucosidase 12 n=1 Tax=Elaeis guineensis var. tenera TaxID=51953 RepID=A0A6I9QKY8_ELAGV|nr:beta-glucosidase 12 [Elaeis guineensis]